LSDIKTHIENAPCNRPFRMIFLIISKIGESLGSYQEYFAKSVGKQGEEFLIVALVQS
jgi:hypothetical protein